MSYKQRIFDKVWDHFVVNNAHRSFSDGEPLYYGENGDKCAIGIFIPENIYKQAMEGNEVETILARWPMLLAYMITSNFLPEDSESEDFSNCICLLGRLQEWHDDERAIYELEEIAEDFNLCSPQL